MSLLLAGNVAAKGKSNVKAKAAQYFARGELLFDSGDFAKAAEAFRLAYDLAPHPTVLANIAMSYDKADKVVEAVEFYEKYLGELSDKKERREIESRLAKLSARIGELSIVCPSSECRIEVDGVDRGTAPITLSLEVGSHRVEAFIGQDKIAAVDTRVASGESSTVELFQRDAREEKAGVEEGPEEPVVEEPVVEETPPSPEDERMPGAGFWISTGATVAAGAVAVVFGVMTLKDKDEFDDGGGTDPDLRDKGERDKLITNVMIGVTGAAAASAVAFLIVDLSSSKNGEEEPVAIGPGPGAGLAVTGSF